MIDWSVAIESYLELRSIAPKEEEELRSTRVDWSVAIVSHASHAPWAGAKCSYGRPRARLKGILIEFEAEPSLQNRTLAGSCARWRGGGARLLLLLLLAVASHRRRRRYGAYYMGNILGEEELDCYCCWRWHRTVVAGGTARTTWATFLGEEELDCYCCCWRRLGEVEVNQALLFQEHGRAGIDIILKICGTFPQSFQNFGPFFFLRFYLSLRLPVARQVLPGGSALHHL